MGASESALSQHDTATQFWRHFHGDELKARATELRGLAEAVGISAHDVHVSVHLSKRAVVIQVPDARVEALAEHLPDTLQLHKPFKLAVRSLKAIQFDEDEHSDGGAAQEYDSGDDGHGGDVNNGVEAQQ